MFTLEEIAYIQSQPLARLATVSPAGQPDVSPVGFRFDGSRFYITGADITRTFKYKNVKAGNPRVSLVIDDLATVNPWKPRSVKIHGTAEIGEANGRAILIITPQRSWSLGIHATEFRNGVPTSRQAHHVSDSV